MLSGVTDIIGHVGNIPFGRFTTSNPHTIYVNIQKLESELRSRLSGQPEETIQQELDNQIVKTIMHEATHQKEFTERGFSSESGPDQKEKEADKFLQPIELKAQYRKLITLKADLLKQMRGENDTQKLEVILEAHRSDEVPGRENIPIPKKRKIPVRSIDEASKLVRRWIEDHDLGGSNVGKQIILFNGSPVAYVSYNGRVWNLNGTPYTPITASMIVVAYVRQCGDKWCVYSKKGKDLGTSSQ